MSRIVEVVAAVIERDGLILIGQRKDRGRHALKWEFPGGKIEPGEKPEAALARELEEELAIQAEIGEQIERYDFNYDSGTSVCLYFFLVTRFAGEPENREFSQIAWVTRENLPEYDFLDGDIEFVRKLAKIPESPLREKSSKLS